MKTTRKYILIALAALVILVGVAVALVLTAPHEAAEESAAPSEVQLEKLLDYGIEDVKSIDISEGESGDSYTLVPTKQSADSEANDTFTVAGWEDLDVRKSDVLSMAQRFYSCSAIREIGEVQDLSEYGLAGEGEYRVDLHLNDGDKTLIIGSPAAESSGRYVLFNGSVYIVAQSSKLSESKYTFIETDALIDIPDPQTEEDDQYGTSGISILDHFYLSGTNFPEEIHLEYDEVNILVYLMTEPIYGGASTTYIDSAVEALQHVSAQNVVAVHATAEDYAAFGLDEPAAVVDYSINGEGHVIRAGSKCDDGYYVEIDGSGVIYTLDASAVELWYDADVFTLRDGFVALPPIMNLRRFTITADGSTEVYEMSREVDEDRTTENSTVYNYFTTLNGEEISYGESFQPFYRDLIAVYVLHEDVREPDGEELLRMKFEFYEDTDLEPIEIVYYASDSEERRCVALFNGQPSGVVRRSEVDRILEGKPIVASGELYEPDD